MFGWSCDQEIAFPTTPKAKNPLLLVVAFTICWLLGGVGREGMVQRPMLLYATLTLTNFC